jgi:hypothetical protein
VNRPEEEQETILCAAVWVDNGQAYSYQPTTTGIVFCGRRHPMVLEQARVSGLSGKKVQGFLTSHNRFVDRREAWLIALEAEQIVRDVGSSDTLYSENLY